MDIVVLAFAMNPGHGLGIVRRHPVGRDKDHVRAFAIGMDGDGRAGRDDLANEHADVVVTMEGLDGLLATERRHVATDHDRVELMQRLT